MGILLLQSYTDPVVPPTGVGGTLLALAPEVGSTYKFSFRTDIHKSWNGVERRIALLGRPRESFEAEFVIDDEDTFRALRSHRVRFPTSPYLMVVWHEGAAAQEEVDTNDVVIKAFSVDWALVGQRVWIEGPQAGFAAVIQTVTAEGSNLRLELDAGPPGTFPNGSAVVYPLRAYYLEDASPLGRYVVNAGRWSARGIAVEPWTSPVGIGAVLNTIGSQLILEPVPVLNGLGAEDRPVGDVEMLDTGARVTPQWSFNIADVVRIHDFVISSAADRQYWKAFIHSVMGSQKTFLLPTYRADIEPIDVAGDTITALYDSEAGFADYGGRRWLRIVDTAGAATVHEVVTTDNDVDLDGNQLIFIFVDPSPPAMANIAEIQWIEQVRFAEDNFVLELQPSGVQRMTLRFLVVQQ